MPLWLTIILIILAVVAAILVVLYFVGTKLQKKQAEQQSMMEAMAQTVSMLVIDKKRMKLKDAGFPPMVYEQTPKYLRRAKVPVVKAKVVVSGIYITAIKSVRGSGITPPPSKKKKKDRKADKQTAKK